MEKHEEVIPETEITPEMIAAAQNAYWDLDERFHSSDERFAAAIMAALQHAPGAGAGHT